MRSVLRETYESSKTCVTRLGKVQMKCFFFIAEFKRAAKIKKIAVYRSKYLFNGVKKCSIAAKIEREACQNQ